MKTYKIAVIVGSLRKDSYNRKIAKELIRLAPSNLELQIVEIGDLALYNEDLETATPPQAWATFRQQINAVQGVIFVTPEYNRSVPAAIKNAIDVGSRPYGQSVWDRKVAAVISSSVGAISGFGANHHLRQSLVFANMPCMQQPEAYLANVATCFDASGTLSHQTEDFLKSVIDAYARWVETIIAC
jgi:chromate reductase